MRSVSCGSFLLCFCDKTMTKPAQGKKGFIENDSLSLKDVSPETQGGKWRQELKWKPWRVVAYWLALSSLLGFCSCTAEAHLPRSGITHVNP